MDTNNSAKVRQQKIFSSDSNFMIYDYKNSYDNAHENFTKGCKWAPDGSCFLTADETQTLKIFNTPSVAITGNFNDEEWMTTGCQKDSIPAVEIHEGETIFDFTWFPQMTSSDPETSCFAATCREMPVHLWDAWNGEMICSYIAYDHLEQLSVAKSICFSPDGSKLICGYKKDIRIFETNRPGKISSTIKSEGHPGIRSSIAFHPVIQNMFAVGSYTGLIGFYSTTDQRNFAVLDGHNKGITNIMFSDDGTKLYSGTRKDSEILCWDIRNFSSVLATFTRDVDTNQRIYFDLSPNGNQYLVSGTTSGNILVWDTEAVEDPSVSPKTKVYKAHQDCVNGVSLNPLYPLMITSSGQRHSKPAPGDSSSDEAETSECTTKLWWIGE